MRPQVPFVFFSAAQSYHKSLSTSTSFSSLGNVEAFCYTYLESESYTAVLIPHGWAGEVWWAPSCPLIPLPLFYYCIYHWEHPLQSREELHILNSSYNTLNSISYSSYSNMCVYWSAVYWDRAGEWPTPPPTTEWSFMFSMWIKRP